MPTASSWSYFIYVNAAFALITALVFYHSAKNEVKQNWAQYRCNPLYMPMSDNIEQDFQYCIQNTQVNFMGYILQPLTYLTSNLTANSGSFMTEINNVRAMFDKVRTFLSEIIQSVFGVFLNIIIEFQKVTISIKDLMGKTIGIMTTLLYVLQGSLMTMESTWAGPVGQSVKTLGKCFHPYTVVELADDGEMFIKELLPGDRLKGGDVVKEVLAFTNLYGDPDYSPLYCIPGDSVSGTPIYVTGEHFIYSSDKDGFVKVRDFAGAHINVGSAIVATDVVYCLVTDTHRIHIGEHVFWDYDDGCLR